MLPRPRLFAACTLALVAAARASLWAQPADIDAIPVSQDYVLRTWDVEDGLPNNNVDGIAQTPDGYLWVATWSGIGRFDGVRFTRFPTRNTPGLETNACNVVLAATDGSLWAGFSNGGLARFRGGTFEAKIPGASSAFPDAARSLAQDAKGAIWVGFVNPRVARCARGAVTEFSPAEGVGPGKFPVVTASRDGTIWLATSEGCAFFDSGRFQKFPASDGDNVRVGAARDGGVWVARGRQLFHYWKNGSREVVADLAWLGGADPVVMLVEDREGNLWIGTRSSGLFRFHGGAFERILLPSTAIAALCEDAEGNLWVGTRGSGLVRLSPRCLFLRKAKTDTQLVRDDHVSSLGVDAEGRLNLVQGFALVRATDSSDRTFAPPPSTVLLQGITTLAPSHEGGLWLGGLGNVLRQWRHGAYSVDQQFPDAIASLLPDHRRNLWIGSIRDGLYLRRPEGTLTHVDAPGLTKPRALAEDAEGRVWVGTASGLVFREEGEAFAPVALPGAKPGQQVQFIVPDGKNVWFGAVEAGLYRWRDGRVEKLPPDAGLPSSDLKALEIAADGSFWFATDRGLYRVERRELEDVLEGRKSTLRAANFGRDHGLPTLNFSFGFLHATARTPDGHLWFATTSGALEIAPDKLRKSAPPHPVVIEDFLLNGKPVPFAIAQAGLELPPQPGAIQIRYTMPQMSTPEQLRFRYRLLGSGDNTWYAADNQRTAVFPNLAPGAYTFEVAAAEPSGPWLPKTASISFAVRAAWWETLGFRLAVILAGALALATLVRAIVHRRMRARIRRLEQEHALERERTRIARDMHDELGARLTHIMLMSELAATEPEPALNLQKIAHTARAVSSTLDEIVWTTNPRNDTLEHLVGYIAEFSGEYLDPTGIDLHLELPARIPAREVSAEKRHNVLLVVKEALNNIVKHAEARRIQLRVTLERDELHVMIDDDGKGFAPETIPATSNGLANMRQRLAAIGGTLEIKSQPGQGTRITLAVKL